jgi:penicillin-binding protein 1A
MTRTSTSRTSLARRAGIVALFVLAAMLGILTGVLLAYSGDLPQVSALDEYTPRTITRLSATDGRVIGEFATERRVLLKYGDIPPVLKHAILAAEDSDFEHHVGIRPMRLLVTVVRNLVYERRLLYAGASTLTQQLARKLFLKPEKTIERKVKEALLALQIEKRYTKPEIFTLYCNQMNFDRGAYGVEAAARLYFGKSVKDLKLEEAAMIAGILQLPERQSPYVNPASQLRAAAHGRRRLHHAGRRRRGQGQTDRARGRVCACQHEGPLLR